MAVNMPEEFDGGFEHCRARGFDTKFAEPARTNPVENLHANHGCHTKINIFLTRENQQNRVKRSKGKGVGS
jgi:hypothetical protein